MDDMERRALAAEALLGFVMLALGKDVTVTDELIEAGFPAEMEVIIEQGDKKWTVGIRQKAPAVVE